MSNPVEAPAAAPELAVEFQQAGALLASLQDTANESYHQLRNLLNSASLKLLQEQIHHQATRQVLASVLPYAKTWMPPHGDGCGDATCPLCRMARAWEQVIAAAENLSN